MRLTLRRFLTKDKLELQGLLFEPDNVVSTSRAVLFIHGAGSSFCGDPFIEKIAEAVTREKISFFSINTRGHSVVSDFRTHEPNGEYLSRRIGHAREIFEECIFDISASVDFLERLGYREIILFGHSLGALKTVYYLSETRDPHIVGIVLASPPDIQGIYRRALELARENAATDKPKRKEKNIVLEKYSDSFPWTQEMRDSFLGSDAKTNIFPFFDPNGIFSALASIRVPICVFYGTVDEPVAISTRTCLNRIRKEACGAPSVSTKRIRGASHSYLGFEDSIAKTVITWVRNTFS